jgi:hypothetical protein
MFMAQGWRAVGHGGNREIGAINHHPSDRHGKKKNGDHGAEDGRAGFNHEAWTEGILGGVRRLLLG